MFWFESIVEILSVPLRNWDNLKLKYKIILFLLVIISMTGIVILLN